MSGEIEYMRPNGIFFYHSTLEFEWIFTLFYMLIEMLLFIFKGFNFPIQKDSISVEIVDLIFFFVINLTRIYMGELGNRAETSLYVVMCILFGIPAIYTYLYFIFMSCYVLEIEIILNAFGLGLVLIEFIGGVVAALSIISQESSL